MRETLVPYAVDLLRGIETRFTERENGKMVLSPLHCVETFYDTKNPVTVVAGLHAVTQRLLGIEKLPESVRAYLEGYRSIIPDVPIEYAEPRRYAPAEEYGKQMNVEPVWLKPVFPYWLHGGGAAGADGGCGEDTR